MSKLSTEKLKTMMIGWITDPAVLNAAVGCLYLDEQEKTQFIKDFSNPKKWKRNSKNKLSSPNGNGYGMEEEWQDIFDTNPNDFGDVAGGMFGRPTSESVFRDFELDKTCIGCDNFRVEIITDPKDQEVQCWQLCAD